MLEHLLEFLGSGHGGIFGGIDGKLNKLLPDVTDRLIRGMYHIFFIEAVVAKLIEKNFVSRKIMSVSEGFTDLIDGQQERRFAQLVLMEAVFEMAQGRDRENELFVRESIQ